MGSTKIDMRTIVPRIPPGYVPHVPHPPQQLLLMLNHHLEVFYGGAAGGGKSDALLMAALQYVDVPGYAALILRRTWPDLTEPGAILDRATKWLTGTNAVMRDGGRTWEFPTSNPDLPARIRFGHMQYEKDKYKYQSAEFQFVAFDELTQFSETSYEYLFSRLRKPRLLCIICNKRLRYSASRGKWRHVRPDGECRTPLPDMTSIREYTPAPDGTSLFDVPIRMRSASNPGGYGHEWVKARFIDPRTRKHGTLFIPSYLDDNPSLDPEEYEKALEHLGPVERERLRRGDWDVTEEGGWFDRAWWDIIEWEDITEEDIEDTVRYWDLAASVDGDYTVGARMSLLKDGRFVLEDIVRGRWRPREVEEMVALTAKMDGTGIRILMEQEPGSAGVNNIDHYARSVLVGYDFDAVRNTGKKEDRAGPLSSAAEKGNVLLVRADWNIPFINEAELFPHGQYDDQVDAAAGAMAAVAFERRGRVLV